MGTLKLHLCFFADDVVLLASSDHDLQHTLEWFTAECNATVMRISTSKSEAIISCQNTLNCPLWAGSEFQPHVKELKYLGVLLTSEGKVHFEINRWIGVVSAVMEALCLCT